MGLFDWLGNLFSKVSATHSSETWQLSENGNPMMIIGDTRITVFEQYNSWKFCIAQVDGDENPYFSYGYEKEIEAKEEALAMYYGLSSTHLSLKEKRSRERIEKSPMNLKYIDNIISQLSGIVQNPDDKTLTQIKKSVDKNIKTIRLSLSYSRQLISDGASDETLDEYEKRETALNKILSDLDKIVEKRTAEGTQKGRKRLKKDN